MAAACEFVCLLLPCSLRFPRLLRRVLNEREIGARTDGVFSLANTICKSSTISICFTIMGFVHRDGSEYAYLPSRAGQSLFVL